MAIKYVRLLSETALSFIQYFNQYVLVFPLIQHKTIYIFTFIFKGRVQCFSMQLVINKFFPKA